MKTIDKIEFQKYVGLKNRDILRKVLLEIGSSEKKTVVLGVDSLNSGSANLFKEKYPKRIFDFGIAEANMISAAAGFSLLGKIPIVLFYGFLVPRIAEQIRDDICYNNCNVKMITNTSGFNLSTAGATHHGIEDVSILNCFPNLTIIQPATPKEAIVSVFQAVLDYKGPVYLRLTRQMEEEIYSDDQIKKFKIGKSITLRDGNDISLIATGKSLIVAEKAANILQSKGLNIRLIDMHTIKPIDKEVIIKAAQETKGIITIEDGNLNGGLGSTICQITAQFAPTMVKMIGVPFDKFTIIGPSEESLWDYYGLDVKNIELLAYSILQC